MNMLPRPMVDVREMLCAQALAVLGRAIQRVAVGDEISVRYNSADVRQDIVTWAADRGHRITAQTEDALHLIRQRKFHGTTSAH